jgi:hypothetical protein
MWTAPGAKKLDNCELYFDAVDEDLDYLDFLIESPTTHT